MIPHDGSLTPHLLYESDHLQCNMLHTPSVYDGAVFGFGSGKVWTTGTA